MIKAEYHNTKMLRRICAPFLEARRSVYATDGSINSAHSDKGAYFARLFRKNAIQSKTTTVF